MKTRCLLLSLLAFSAAPAWAESEPSARNSVLSVRGTGRYEQKPDFAEFTVIVSTAGKTLNAAVDAHRDRATRGLEALQKLEASGIRIRSSRFGVTEEKRPSYTPPTYAGQPAPPPPKISDAPFTAKTWFELNAVSMDTLNQTVTQIAATGLFEIQRVIFKIKNERTALNEARKAAMTDARGQADAYSSAGDLKLVEITEVTDGEAKPVDGYADLPMGRFLQIIPPAVVSFDATVNVTWRIAPR
ncbi:SIMPL domain-containing protein [Methylobacterium trifolii]|uniref:DUF541 domain-containing protein n=1 Tax=Methylobacterium trifolii TaxID=1003092 RepID=A0ABQ4U3W0_9HYPH|nr:SIMPL domain-containing protein [Methylobacterium trifolii]GJE62173.1 hypothetical protein MPOCJGCO_4303 [Methylobacterium trifolii]